MKITNEFLIPFIGLKLGKHQFEYQIGKPFFETFEYDEFISADIKVDITLEKGTTMLELKFEHNGFIKVPCDLTNEEFDLPIKGNLKLVVRFGEVYNNDNEELLILPFGEHQIDVAQYIYEMIVLSIPLKKVHPGIKDGSLKSDVIKILENLNTKDTKKTKEEDLKEENTDPRWDKLKKLLTDK